LVTSTNIDQLWADYIESRRLETRDALIVEYAPLVRFTVNRLGIPQTSLLESEDLYSYGMIGLINAIDRFDPSRGVRFEAFATARIRGAVIDELRALNWMPRSAVARVRQIETALAVLEQRLGRPANEQEAADEVGVPLKRYRQMLLEVGIVILSLDAPLTSLAQDDEITSLSDLIEDAHSPEPSEQAEQRELLASLTSAVDHLPERERLLLSCYYFEELTMKEISAILKVSESRVCQLHMQAILRLRAALNVQQGSENRSSRLHSRRKPPSMTQTATEERLF
jgi:RNA polymerase sigma factor for flagellar operon FliA